MNSNDFLHGLNLNSNVIQKLKAVPDGFPRLKSQAICVSVPTTESNKHPQRQVQWEESREIACDTSRSVKMDIEQLTSLEASRTALQATPDASLRVPCYCEENVWRLAYRKVYQKKDGETYHVAFVSNPKGCVPMFQQRAAEDPYQPVRTEPYA